MICGVRIEEIDDPLMREIRILDKMIDEQSAETDVNKRKAMVTKIEQALLKDAARPPITHGVANTCWAPAVKNLVLQHNSIYNGWRLEDVWLDK